MPLVGSEPDRYHGNPNIGTFRATLIAFTSVVGVMAGLALWVRREGAE